MNLLHAALLGIVQGLTEFLPVSSSAHLILVRAFFGIDADQFGMIFDVALHLGTLAAVVVYFWHDLMDMLRALPHLFSPGSDPKARLIWLIVIATIPAVIVGGLFADYIEEHLRTPMSTVLQLAIGAIVFLVAERISKQNRTERDLTAVDALVIGCAQATALAPGISRSGATITAGLLLGVKRLDAARFAFLISIPAILGAAAKEGIKLRHLGITAGMGEAFLVGIVISAIVGYLTVAFLVRYLATHRLDLFAYYRLALALVVWIAFH